MSERILLVEDDRELRLLLREVLEDAGYDVAVYPTGETAVQALTQGVPADLVITDLIMPGMRGHELLRAVRSLRPELNVVVMTAFGSIDSAIELVKAGAYDYVPKPFANEAMLLVVERALHESRLRRDVARLTSAGGVTPPGIIAASRSMHELFALMRRAAPSPHPVLITGESGVGKALLARALHEMSGRAGSFVAVQCVELSESRGRDLPSDPAAQPTENLEQQRLLESARGGTLFLDDVTELSSTIQLRMLRALEQDEAALGGDETGAPRARIMASARAEAEELVAAGRLRSDLFWRLSVIQLHVPALRERIVDIPLLAEHFLERARLTRKRRLAPDTVAILTAYPWPGNVRELRHAIESAAALSMHDEIRPDDLPPRIAEAGRAATLVAGATQRQLSLRDLERSYILEVLRSVGGNKSRAAEILGLDRKTLYRKLEEYAREDGGATPP